MFGFTYSRPLLTDTNFNHQWSAGFQNKSFENQIDADGSVIDSDVTSFPLELGYSFNSTGKSSVVSGSLLYAMNLESGSNNSDEDYAAVRPDAESDWSALRYDLAYDRYFGQEWMFHAGLSGQISSDLLISGEQFGVGGSSTLRGFEERSVTGDEGHQISLELWPQPIAGVRYLVFVDQASLKFNDGVDYDLSSYGVGLRWGWKQQLSISLDVGVIIDGLDEDEGVNAGASPSERINLDDDNRAHFNLIYRF